MEEKDCCVRKIFWVNKEIFQFDVERTTLEIKLNLYTKGKESYCLWQ